MAGRCGEETAIMYTAIMVFAITGIGYAIGKLNKFGDSDELVNLDDKQGGRQNDDNTDLDVMFCRSYGSADDPVSLSLIHIFLSFIWK